MSPVVGSASAGTKAGMALSEGGDPGRGRAAMGRGSKSISSSSPVGWVRGVGGRFLLTTISLPSLPSSGMKSKRRTPGVMGDSPISGISNR